MLKQMIKASLPDRLLGKFAGKILDGVGFPKKSKGESVSLKNKRGLCLCHFMQGFADCQDRNWGALWQQQKAGSEKYITMPLFSVSNSCSIELESSENVLL